MARWNPPDSVGANEQIGRRLFDEPMLAGVAGQPSFGGLQLTNFEETRDAEVSLDRMGSTGVDGKVVNYLLPRAKADGKKFAAPKSFDGWAIIKASKLAKAPKSPPLDIFASPIKKPEPEDNIYHAHVLRPTSMDAHSMALHLRHIFTQHGNVKAISKIAQQSAVRRWLKLKIAWLRSKLTREKN